MMNSREMNINELYKNDFIECAFCGKYQSLSYAKQHLKSKTCIEFQNLLGNDEQKVCMIKFLKDINRLRSEIKLNLPQEVNE